MDIRYGKDINTFNEPKELTPQREQEIIAELCRDEYFDPLFGQTHPTED